MVSQPFWPCITGELTSWSQAACCVLMARKIGMILDVFVTLRALNAKLLAFLGRLSGFNLFIGISLA
jgi:hypothetical protein